MNDRPARLKQQDGPPEIEITVGQANFGKFRIVLWDKQGRNPTVLGESTNVDNIPDIFAITPTTQAAHELIVSWEAIVAAFDDGAGQYTLISEVKQDGVTVQDGETLHKGDMAGSAQLVYGSTRLVVS